MDGLTSDKAREIFKESGLNYNDMYDFRVLLIQEIQDSIKEHHERNGSLPMDICNGVSASFFKGTRDIRQMFLRVDGSYFTRRECVSFNPDGFIGFAGWASSLNVAPILQGFIDAVALIKLVKSSRNLEKYLPVPKPGSGCVHFGSKLITAGPLKGLHYCDSCGWVHVDGSDYFQMIEKSRP